MEQKSIIPLLLLAFAATFYCCNNAAERKVTKHYSEATLKSFSKICDQQKSRDTGIYLIDSLYKTFPYISAPDKYRYYDFKRDLFELIRFGKHSYDTAVVYVDSMIAVIEDNGLEKKMPKEYIAAFSIRGEYYTRTEHYSNAILDITHCKQLNEKAGDSCLMAENNKTLSTIAIQQSNYSLAESLMKEALALAAYCKNDKDQFIRMQRYLDDLGYIYASQKKYDSAVIYHLAAIKYIRENERLMSTDTLFISEALENIYGNLAFAYYFQNKFADAKFYLEKALFIDQEILHNGIHTAQVQYILGLVYLKSGHINEAEAMAERSSTQIDNFDIPFKIDVYLLKADIAKAKKQYKEEAVYRQQLSLAKDSLNYKRLELLKNNPFKEYDELDKKYQVELLKKDNRNQQNKTNAAITIGVLLTLLAAISFYFLWRLRALMKKRSVLYKALKNTMAEKEIAEKQLREKELFSQEMRLNMEFNEAIIKQRRQISDDMHDELSSSLAALKFYAEDIKNQMLGTDAEKPLITITEEINSVYESARRYMHSLNSNNWETQLSLIGFLKEIQKKFSENNLLDIKLDVDEEKIKTDLTSLQHDQLYHIIKESISNIIKHANASELIIAILFNDNNCNFSISDNGKGYKKDDIVYGIGINSMIKRVKELGGELIIDSSSAGTVIKGHFSL